MTEEKTPAEKLASTLDYLVDKGYVPGLLPEDVRKASRLLVEQEKELAELRTALACKSHHVSLETIERDPFSRKLRGTFVAADPVMYYGEVFLDEEMIAKVDYRQHVVRRLVDVAMDMWKQQMRELAWAAFETLLRRERECPGHEASDYDPKVCRHCRANIAEEMSACSETKGISDDQADSQAGT